MKMWPFTEREFWTIVDKWWKSPKIALISGLCSGLVSGTSLEAN